MGNRYILKSQNITPTAGNDIWTIIPAASRRIRLISVSVAGRGTSSAAQQLEVGTSSGGTTGSAAVTPTKADHVDQPAAASTVDTAWVAQPTLDTNTEVIGWNALGGANRYIGATKGGTGPASFEVRGNAAYISIRASAGVTFQPMSIAVVYEED